jgi:hypothetical protein
LFLSQTRDVTFLRCKFNADRKGLGVEALGGDGRDNAAGRDDGFNANDIFMVTVMMEEIKWKQLTG